jgi:hypothetical protein
MGSEVTELMAVPFKAYLSLVEYCGGPIEESDWIVFDAESTASGSGGSKAGDASRPVQRSMRRGALSNISVAFASFEGFGDSLQRL